MKRHHILLVILTIYAIITVFQLRSNYVMIRDNISQFNERHSYYEYSLTIPQLKMNSCRTVNKNCAIEIIEDPSSTLIFLNIRNISKEKLYFDPKKIMDKEFLAQAVSFSKNQMIPLTLPILDSQQVQLIHFPIILLPEKIICFPMWL